jgi:hypothetical protein
VLVVFIRRPDLETNTILNEFAAKFGEQSRAIWGVPE